MLTALSIRDFVIVQTLDLDFLAGFSVLTGETGAGKSILVDALSLALGARGESGLVREGCERAEIAASFRSTGNTAAKVWLEQNALQASNAEASEEDADILLKRLVYRDGRSKAFINGSTATVQQLKELGELLVDIYSQHAHHSLLKTAVQREALDAYAECQPLAAEVASHYQRWQALLSTRLQAEKHQAERLAQMQILQVRIEELAPLALDASAWQNLQQTHYKLANTADLLSGCTACHTLLSESDQAVLVQLHQIQEQLSQISDYDPALQDLCDGVTSARIQLQEIARDLNRYQSRAELDPAALAAAENQIQVLHALGRKYRVKPEQLHDLLSEAEQEIAKLQRESDTDSLHQQELKAAEHYQRLASKLSALRQSAALKLGQAITAEMQQLGLHGGSFAIELQAQTAAASGLESVEFLVAGHVGSAPKPLVKVASGGELSRISLAMRVVMAQHTSIPSMIFDEVDVGIGGGVAEVVGRLLHKLGESRQVLVITHLPQVAARGEHHYRVSKQQQAGMTLSEITQLDKPARVEEIARMLGGVAITETSRQHAKEMLGFS